MYELIALIIASLIAISVLALSWKRFGRWMVVLLFMLVVSTLINTPMMCIGAWVDWRVLDMSQRSLIQSYLDNGAMITDGVLEYLPKKHTVSVGFPEGHPHPISSARVVLFPYESRLGTHLSVGLLTAIVLAGAIAAIFALIRRLYNPYHARDVDGRSG
jgi:magnesium-transporting ATPase (P-type)